MTKAFISRLLVPAAAGLIATFFTQAALAQFAMPGLDLGGSGRQYTPEEKERMQEIDKEYKETIKKVPDKQKSSDPWARIRQDPSSTTKR